MREIKWILLFLLISAFSYAQVETEIDTLKMISKQTDVSAEVAVISESELSSDEESTDISGILQSSRDVFVSTAGYTFGSAVRFRIRGYDSENTMVSMNGVNLNDMESGRVYWSTWGGLNDALRNTEVLNGITDAQFSFGGIGGATNMEARASSYSPTVKFTYSHANRSYNNRIMFTYATGLRDNGWALTFSGSRRWAQEGYIKGTPYDAYSYFLAVEKKLNDKHSIGFIGYGSPNKRGKASAVVQEAYDLSGSNYYNPYWGFQNGEVRNSRMSNYHKPMLMLSHYFTPDESTKLTTTLSYMFGRGGSTALNWYKGNDPRPDYYRNLPSYWVGRDDDYAAELTEKWTNDESFRQIDWDRIYHGNYNGWAVIENVDGVEGNTVYGRRANTIVEDRRNDSKKWNLTSVLNKQINENLELSGGLDLTNYKGDRYTIVDDLLGGDFYYDINKFVDRDFRDPSKSQSDLNNPNRIVKEGDIFGYHYTANVNKYMAWAQMAFEYNRFDYYVGGNVSFDEFWRTGHMKTGIYPSNSYGDSEKTSFVNFGIKGGATYKISGRHYLSTNLMYQTRSPQFRDAFLSARTRNEIVNNITNEKVSSADINYVIRYPKFNARFTAYYSRFDDKIRTRSYYDEGLQAFVNYSVTGLDIVNRGIEFGSQYEILTGLKLNLVAALGEYYYASRANSTSTADNIGQVLTNETVYIKNYYVGGPPQTALSAGLDYRTSFFMFFGIDINYFDNAYLPMQFERRTERAVAGMDPEHPDFQAIIAQEKLPSGFTVDLNVGKSWRIDYKYFISLNLSANNILNNRELITGGYEQFRFAGLDINRFGNKYYYMFGTTFFLNVNFRF